MKHCASVILTGLIWKHFKKMRILMKLKIAI